MCEVDTPFQTERVQKSYPFGRHIPIGYIHDTRHLRTRKDKTIKFADARNRSRLCLFSENETTI